MQSNALIKQQVFKELHNRNIREHEPLPSALELKNGLYTQHLAK